jgi:hypothetical protein
MKALAFSLVALGIMTSAALADSVRLTDEQMDNVSAGTVINLRTGHSNDGYKKGVKYVPKKLQVPP